MERKKIAAAAPLRARKVSERSFGQSEKLLSYLFNRAAKSPGAVEKTRRWNEFIPLTPTAACKILRRDLPRDMAVSLVIKADGSGDMVFQLDGKFRDRAYFNFPQKLLDAGIIRVESGHMGKGYGRTLFRNQIEFFYICGARRFEILASLENGGYSWARAGFLPDDIDSEDFLDDCLLPALSSARALAPLLTGREKKTLTKILTLRHREDFWKIADAPIDIGKRLTISFNIAAGGHDAPMRTQRRAQKLLKALEEHFGADLYAYMKERAAMGESVRIGRLLLTGTSWSGAIDMENPAQMRRFGDYAGGFKYLRLG